MELGRRWDVVLVGEQHSVPDAPDLSPLPWASPTSGRRHNDQRTPQAALGLQGSKNLPEHKMGKSESSLPWQPQCSWQTQACNGAGGPAKPFVWKARGQHQGHLSLFLRSSPFPTGAEAPGTLVAKGWVLRATG